jgi:hypothetical protein
MGMLDHRRTWRYEVKASPSECVEAFARAFSGPGGLVAKAKWDVRRRGNGAVAVYQGRKGIGAIGGILSKTSALEADTAIGSEVTFEIDKGGGEHTGCAMWLSSSGRAGVGGIMGSTSDGRFIRPYMQSVQKEMLALDPSARITTGK